MKDQMSTIHVASPETHAYLMDIIQDAQSLGSIVHVITIIPPFLAVKAKDSDVIKTYNGTSVNEDRSPQCSPDHNPVKTKSDIEVSSPQCSPNHNPVKTKSDSHHQPVEKAVGANYEQTI